VASATADGYTLLVHSAGHVANAALFPQLRYFRQSLRMMIGVIGSPTVHVPRPFPEVL